MDKETLIVTRNELMCNLLQTCANRDILDISQLETKADIIWSWIIRGSDENRPEDNRKDDSLMVAKKPRSVRKGSASQLV